MDARKDTERCVGASGDDQEMEESLMRVAHSQVHTCPECGSDDVAFYEGMGRCQDCEHDFPIKSHVDIIEDTESGEVEIQVHETEEQE